MMWKNAYDTHMIKHHSELHFRHVLGECLNMYLYNQVTIGCIYGKKEAKF